MRTIARTDSNQSDIVKQLRQRGCSVVSIHQVGKDVPDLLVGYRGKNFLFEIKTAKGKLSKGQEIFLQTWSGQADKAMSFEECWQIITKYLDKK